MGHGQRQPQPSLRTATSLPKRRMTPRSAAFTWKKPLASHRASDDAADDEQERAALAAFAARAAAAIRAGAASSSRAHRDQGPALAGPPAPGIVVLTARLIPRHRERSEPSNGQRVYRAARSGPCGALETAVDCR